MFALGISANEATFTLLNAMWLRPLPHRHADRLVTLVSFKTLGIGESDPKGPESRCGLSHSRKRTPFDTAVMTSSIARATNSGLST